MGRRLSRFVALLFVAALADESCAPGDATRPLAFSRMRARYEGQQRRAVVRCTLHASSVACACCDSHASKMVTLSR